MILHSSQQDTSHTAELIVIISRGFINHTMIAEIGPQLFADHAPVMVS